MRAPFAIFLIAAGAVASSNPVQAELSGIGCSMETPDAATPDERRIHLIQINSGALGQELRRTYAERLAGLFVEPRPEYQFVVRLTGSRPVSDRHLEVCGFPVTVRFETGATHTHAELRRLHEENMPALFGLFPSLQGSYADERTTAIRLDVLKTREDESAIEARRLEAEALLGVPVHIEMTDTPVTIQPALAGSER